MVQLCGLLTATVWYCVTLQITQDQVGEFLLDGGKFNEKFKMEGPGCVGTDLDKGWLNLGITCAGMQSCTT